MSSPRLNTPSFALLAALAVLVTAVPADAGQRPGSGPEAPPPVDAPAAAPAVAAPSSPSMAPVQEAAAPRPPRPRTYTLQVIILRAREGEPSLPDLPEDALAALRDLQELMRYRHFEVVDTGWIRTQEGGQARLGEAGAFEVYARLEAPQPAPPGTTRAAGSDRIVVRHFELGYWPWEKDETRGEIYYADEPRGLLSSTFALDAGETVVVGTSRLTDADEALVVLVKAME